MNLDFFKSIDSFYKGLQTLFNYLNIPVNYIDEKPLRPEDILSKISTSKNKAYKLMDDVYILGMVDDAAFDGENSKNLNNIKNTAQNYPGIVIFGVTLKQDSGNLPTRTELSEITRAFNQEYKTMPVVVVFRYGNYISLASTERLKYKQEWREGEKTGKVSILRDVEIEKPHTGHLKILEELKITRSGIKGINSFEGLYQYWQEVFSVNLLNKKFYSELSNWYFWAIKHVTFPSEPTIHSIFAETGSNDNSKLEAVKQEFKAKNVIRLLTRLLFVWFIKEKKLIPEDLFNLEALQKTILKKISPFHEKDSLFKEENKESIYYKAILQNLFFATLNCPVKPDSVDSRERGFRGEESYGKHRGIDYLMRYKKHFKDPDAFLEMVNRVVPFLNGGLFECLDDKDKKIYIDGFSDNMSKTNGVVNHLIVPDFLFFGREEKTDLSSDYGTKNKGTKEAAVKGLINILKSYKFTIAENTPVEEDVALDPELLGKVFENLLASYNPETKTTARKQTGSFYTPREIVNYMVDESLIAHLKNGVSNWDMEEKELDEKLHQLVSFDPTNPFENKSDLSKEIIYSLDNCKILDPACGSGAFPMGILQKMVHILQKIDPENNYWQDLQLENAKQESDEVFAIRDKRERELLLLEINEAFDQTINNPDYARKLFLIENCIYGVDIQPIAAQISKLRFFISLVVEQKVNKDKENFGIRPLPNLETKFVTANTLIGIDKPDSELFYTKEVQEKEAELKGIRHKLFGAKTKVTKVKYRKRDEELRNEIADILKKGNLPVESAEQLASWDPYDQNGVSPFFDPEWMFDIKDGFDIVIGNPPYLKERDNASFFAPINNSNFGQKWHQGKMDFWFYFLHKAIDVSKSEICFITSRYWLNSQGAKKLIKRAKENLSFINVVDIGKLKVFDSVAGHHMVSHFSKLHQEDFKYIKLSNDLSGIDSYENINNVEITQLSNSNVFKENNEIVFSKDCFADLDNVICLGDVYATSIGIQESVDKISKKQLEGYNANNYTVGQGVFVLTKEEVEKLNLNQKELQLLKPYVDPNDVFKYGINVSNLKYLIYSDKIKRGFISNNSDYLRLKNHLDYLQDYITSSNKPYGVHRARKEKYFNSPKIIFKNMFAEPNFAYDDSNLYFGFSFSSIIQENQSYSLKYLLAILNSSFANKWFYTFGKLRGVGVDIGVKKLRLFPIRKPSKSIESLLTIVVNLESSARQLANNSSIHFVIDALIFELYFPDHMKEQKIDVMKFVEKDIDEVMQGKEFGRLNDSQKREAITELHDRWSDPDNEIVKRMNSFSEKSPEILKPILEG